MAPESDQDVFRRVLALAEAQHEVVTTQQLLELGLSRDAIRHRVGVGRLFGLHRGVYAVGRPRVGRLGAFLAAVLACGEEAVLSHESAAALWGIRPDRPARPIEVVVPAKRRRPGIEVHRRGLGADERTRRRGLPVTSPAVTLCDLAPRLDQGQLERAIGEADRLGLIDPERLRKKLDRMDGRAGVRPLRRTLERHTFRLTDSELERRFLPIARRAGLPVPQTRNVVNGFPVDFFWPELGLVVETDGLRYHRTPAQQTKDRLRDQAHTAAGMAQLRFTRAQVFFDAEHVEATLAKVGGRLRLVS
ncbi:MAG: type IV toxin-antitoxin system AbiEi family antitoxin domain-containing protein [Actinomycetota bacterium]|nr:type IV toxin-antitoxin system AbiEi family antitoxin domain-containing protein [Actinomycetota bacterium]MDQ3647923.1 type IV toxin-antitoxin system AbiEi family antitoxin domain-containing protein [Actinomycetota bacterium]